MEEYRRFLSDPVMREFVRLQKLFLWSFGICYALFILTTLAFGLVVARE
ncbi:hypothetical protein [Ammonifex thiophilus]|nr:hypothetical protein [Ammonifex thiophilus]